MQVNWHWIVQPPWLSVKREFARPLRALRRPSMRRMTLSSVDAMHPSLGCSARSPNRREHPLLASDAQWEKGRAARNTAVFQSIHSSNDVDFDIAAFEKSLAERDRGVLVGPFEVGRDFAIGPACFVPRRGIWGLHGGATEPCCRVISVLVFGEQTVPWRGSPPICRLTLVD